MPWRVGLDEAGYGPNLGPLVLSSSACRVPADAPDCLWVVKKDAWYGFPDYAAGVPVTEAQFRPENGPAQSVDVERVPHRRAQAGLG